MRPLALLVLAEFLVIVLLAMLWLAGTSAAVAGAPPRADGDTARPVSAADAAAGSKGETRTPVNERHAAAPTVPEYRADDPIGIVVSGTVRSTDGKPVADANVGFQREGEYRGGSSAANGAYAAARLQPGEWQLTCRAEGFARHEVPCTLDTRAFQQVDVELRPAYVVKVRVQTAAGEFLPDLLIKKNMWADPNVVATTEPLAGDLPITHQSRLLTFGVAEWYSVSGYGQQVDKKLKDAGYAGELRLNQEPPVFASLLLRNVLLQSQRVDPGQHELTFTIEAKDVTSKLGAVKLRLIDGLTGGPVAKARVRLATAQGGGSFATTDAEGKAVVENAIPGLGNLQVGMLEREPLMLYVRVPPGGVVDLGDLVFSPMVTITGRVVDEDGKPPAEASVQWTDLDRRTWPQPLVGNRSGEVESDGQFSLSVGRHRYVVFAHTADGRSGHATVDATGGQPPPVTIRLARTTRIGYRASFGPTVAYTVTVLDQDRTPVSVHLLGSDYRARGTTLSPGAYTVEIHDAADRLVRSLPLQVGADPLTIDVP